MSVNYGGPPTGGFTNAPLGRVDFGWIGQAFELFKANWVVWVVATLMLFVPSVIAGIIGGIVGANEAQRNTGNLPPPYGAYPGPPSMSTGLNMLSGNLPPALSVTINIISLLYAAWLNGGVYRTAVMQVRGEPISISDLFSGGSVLWKMLGFNIIYSLAYLIGLAFFIVPGFLVLGLLLPAVALIVDGESVGNAISRSVDAMKKDMWNAAAFVFVMFLVLCVSIIPCGLGLFVTIPMYVLIAALAYRDMIGMPGGTSGPVYGMPSGYSPPQAGVWPPPPETRPPAFGRPIDPEPPSTLPPTE